MVPQLSVRLRIRIQEEPDGLHVCTVAPRLPSDFASSASSASSASLPRLLALAISRGQGQ